jgi:hypothetical protein
LEASKNKARLVERLMKMMLLTFSFKRLDFVEVAKGEKEINEEGRKTNSLR